MLRLYAASSILGHTTIDALRRLRGDMSGVTAIEYGLIAGAIAVAIIATIIALGGDLRNLFNTTGSALTSTTAQPFDAAQRGLMLLPSAALAIYGLALLGAGLSDLVRYQIPNTICVALVVAFAFYAPSLPLAAVAWHVACGVAILAATALLFAFRLIGGGDAKLLAATALWVGWQNLASFLLVTAIAGGILGLLLLGLRRFAPAPAPRRWYGRLLARGEGVPYGMAIAVSGLALLPRLAPGLLQ